VFLGFKDADRKKPRYKIVQAKSQQVVARRVKELVRLKNSGLDLSADRITLAKYLDQWLTERVQRRVRPSTFVSYSMLVKLHIIPSLGSFRLGKIAALDIQRLVNQKHDEGLSPRSVRYLYSVLRSALKQAKNGQLIERNPSEGVDLPRLRKFKIDPYTPDEARRFLEAIQLDRLRALYVVAISTGMRQGELLALQWDNVDLNSNSPVVRIENTIRRTAGKLRLSDPKSDSSRRFLPLPQIAVDALASHRARQEQERLLTGSKWKETGFVFTTTVGTAMDGSSLSNRFRKLLTTLKLRVIRFHDLRHTAASLLINEGDGPRQVMEMLGHSQISLTMDLYSHIFESTKRESARKMDQVLKVATTPATTPHLPDRIN
jgi:integrase